MKVLGSPKNRIAQLVVLTTVFMSACGIQGTAGKTCGANVAQISILDNIIRRDCGCTEGGGATFGNTGMVCTVPLGTRLYIDYVNIQNPHQLTFSTTAIGTLSYHDPASDGDSNPIDAVTLNATGTVTFVDTGLGFGGTIITQ